MSRFPSSTNRALSPPHSVYALPNPPQSTNTMCKKLLQPFACGHSKPICTTPCPHALSRTQQQQPQTSAPSRSIGTSLARSDSTALGISLARSDSTASSVQSTTIPTQNRSLGRGYIERLKPRALQRQWSTISLKAQFQSRYQTYMQPHGPGFRFVAPGESKRSVEAGGGSSVPATPASVVSDASTAVEDWPLPTPSTTGSFPLRQDLSKQEYAPVQQHSTALPSPALPSPAQPPPTPINSTNSSAPQPSSQFCDYFFPHYLVTSQYSCCECYGNAEWEGLRKRWVGVYRVGHSMDNLEDVERLSGLSLYIKSGDGGDVVDGEGGGEGGVRVGVGLSIFWLLGRKLWGGLEKGLVGLMERLEIKKIQSGL